MSNEASNNGYRAALHEGPATSLGGHVETPCWRKCSSCKKPIGFNARYFTCSVSTCNGQRTGYVFCSVPCFEVHLPTARHKDAAAMENKSPAEGAAEPRRIVIANSSADLMSRASTPANMAKSASAATPASASQSSGKGSVGPKEVLVIASRLKDYIQARSDMNTSAAVMDVLSDHLRVITDRAIENARSERRKTVLDRDYQFLKK